MNKNKKLLEEFVEYCRQHPKQRFWQALRNWSGQNFILVSKDFLDIKASFRDTFYWENKND